VSGAGEPALLPVFLKLRGRDVLVVGGGRVAEAKLEGLLAASARVRLVAPEVRDTIAARPVHVVRREFRADDLDGAWLAIAAASPAVNREVQAAAEARGVFVNAVDDPAHGSAYLGGVLRRGGVTIAVSTEGKAPALAGLLREALEAALPEDTAAWVAAAEQLRAEQKRARVPMAERRPLLLQALNRLYERHRDSLPGSERGDAGGAAEDPLQQELRADRDSLPGSERGGAGGATQHPPQQELLS